MYHPLYTAPRTCYRMWHRYIVPTRTGYIGTPWGRWHSLPHARYILESVCTRTHRSRYTSIWLDTYIYPYRATCIYEYIPPCTHIYFSILRLHTTYISYTARARYITMYHTGYILAGYGCRYMTARHGVYTRSGHIYGI
jgi:hypothetical protein